MTLAARNNFIRIATLMVLILSVVCIAAFIIMLVRGTIPSIPDQARPLGILSVLPFMPYSPVAALAAISFLPLLSLTGLIYIMFAFEKTQTTEITFFAAGVFTLALEAFRIVIPFNELWMSTGFILAAVSRVSLFCRLFIVLCLLSSILFTTGETTQQIGPAIFLTAFFSFSLVNAVPFNTSNLTTTWVVPPGYSGMLYLFLGILGLLAAISYRVQGRIRNAPEYSRAAWGILLLLGGYALLIVCDSWILFGVGVFAIIEGAWRYLRQIHRYYLWQ